ncbi:MAG: glycogen debranching protein GlgX [Deltaproteobacteria bacterium]
MSSLRIWPGWPYPLGATWNGEGTNFAIFSEHATGVELLLYEKTDDAEPAQVVSLSEKSAYVWHCFLPDVRPPQLYAYRIHGPYEPEKGHRFNPNKVMLDPYAKAIDGKVLWDDAIFGYTIGAEEKDLSFDERDSSPFVPKSVVTDPYFDWENDFPLRIPWNETVIYEAHVKGLTRRHPDVDEDERGTYSGLASPPVLNHLQEIGVTAIELLPVHHHLDDRLLVERGLTNYWGYNTIGYFAPEAGYSSLGSRGAQVFEFKKMVKALHRGGIEVILDVVYNHTAEGNHLGPTLCFRGIDNAAYYRLDPDDLRYYMDFSGTGNSLRMEHPQVIQLIMDSLRYWVLDMHVDGFRFDLAATLARQLYDVNLLSAFFQIIQQDPILSQIKLIAEPWDVGEGGYQVGKFPPLWTEWNGRFRDTMRSFWKGDASKLPELGYRLTGSSDLYQDTGRKPYASINFITAHDGFTLRDLVSYNQKHNQANKEDNRDGRDDNRSWNCGVEGTTDDPDTNALRLRQQKNLLASLFFSQGVPMLLGGDELVRTKGGNNNSYCQDNETNWFNWQLDNTGEELLAFTRWVINFRKKHPAFRRRKFFQGRRISGTDVKDIVWLRPDGGEMSEADWEDADILTVGVLLAGDAIAEKGRHGQPITDDTFLLLLNAFSEDVHFRLPDRDRVWELLLDTSQPTEGRPRFLKRQKNYNLESRSFALLREKKKGPG